MSKPELASQVPHNTVDCIIELPAYPQEGTRIVLVRRSKAPLGWALPGGFCNLGESLHDACVREVREETGLDVELTEQFHTYSDPNRDPRHHVITTVFLGRPTRDQEIVGADDAAEARAWDVNALPLNLCFDHRTIIDDYLAYRREGKRRSL